MEDGPEALRTTVRPKGEQLLKLIVISEVCSAVLNVLWRYTGNSCGAHCSSERPGPGEQLHKEMGVLSRGLRDRTTG